jgi:hypothetical protein
LNYIGVLNTFSITGNDPRLPFFFFKYINHARREQKRRLVGLYCATHLLLYIGAENERVRGSRRKARNVTSGTSFSIDASIRVIMRTPAAAEKVENQKAHEVRTYHLITYYWTVPLILDYSYLVGKLTTSKIADTKVAGF